MSQQREPVTVALSTTPGQWVSGFVWVVLGVLIGGFFIWLSGNADELNIVALVLGIAVLVLALTSAVLEFRALPGVTLEFTEATLTVRPRSRAPLVVPLTDIVRLQTLHVAPARRSRRRRDLMSTPPATSRPIFSRGQDAGWHLQVMLTSEESAGGPNGFPIGMRDDAIEELRAACAQFGVRLKLAE